MLPMHDSLGLHLALTKENQTFATTYLLSDWTIPQFPNLDAPDIDIHMDLQANDPLEIVSSPIGKNMRTKILSNLLTTKLILSQPDFFFSRLLEPREANFRFHRGHQSRNTRAQAHLDESHARLRSTVSLPELLERLQPSGQSAATPTLRVQQGAALQVPLLRLPDQTLLHRLHARARQASNGQGRLHRREESGYHRRAHGELRISTRSVCSVCFEVEFSCILYLSL